MRRTHDCGAIPVSRLNNTPIRARITAIFGFVALLFCGCGWFAGIARPVSAMTGVTKGADGTRVTKGADGTRGETSLTERRAGPGITPL